MKNSLGSAIVIPGFFLLATLPASEARSGDAAQPSWSPKEAAAYMDGRADWWLKWSGAARGQGTACASCHTSTPIALARSALAEPLGEAVAGATEQKLIDNMKKRVENWGKIVDATSSEKDHFQPYYSDKEEESLGTESVMNALILVNQDARRAKGILSATTKKALGHLWEQQEENGAWQWLDFGLNPWEKDGAYYGACLAAVAVGSAGKSYYEQPEVQAKVAALKKYLVTKYSSQPLHHRVLALWASSTLPDALPQETRRKLVEEMLNLQEADGGWSLAKLGRNGSGNGGWSSRGMYPAGMVSDGYATGLVVLSLRRAGVLANDPKIKKAIGWLVTNQKEGAWPASYLNKQRDPQDNLGKFMRDAATAFAILALSEPAEPRLAVRQGP